MSRIDLVVTRWGARFMGRRFACAIGRGGITRTKREGDGATPAGTHHFVGLLYRPDRVAATQLPGWALPTGPSDLWSDDSRDPDYNLMVRRPHPWGQERLQRPDPLYDLILITDWNWPLLAPGSLVDRPADPSSDQADHPRLIPFPNRFGRHSLSAAAGGIP